MQETLTTDQTQAESNFVREQVDTTTPPDVISQARSQLSQHVEERLLERLRKVDGSLFQK
ncbi:MAG: hypothetical protein ACREBS_02395 [Nitrososphaerales archaeon]